MSFLILVDPVRWSLFARRIRVGGLAKKENRNV
jgi:hypothetical protein